MARWTIYYLVAILAIIGLNLGSFYVIASNSDGLFAILIFYYAQYFVTVGVVVLQLITFLINYSGVKQRLKFLIAFTTIYSLVFLGIYAAVARYECQMQEAYYLMKAFGPETTETYNTNPFTGLHLAFIVPLLFQIFIFIALFKRQKNILNLTHENTQ